MEHELMRHPRLQIFFQDKNGIERKNQNTRNSYVMGPDTINKCGVTDHENQVYVYDCPVMLRML